MSKASKSFASENGRAPNPEELSELMGEPLTKVEAGSVYHVTRERIRQIEVKALRKLRSRTEVRYLRDYLEI